jgi:dienelactone hydrolase
MISRHFALIFLVALFWAQPGLAVPAAVRAGTQFAGNDTLDCGPDSSPDAAACIAGLKWEKAQFKVAIETSKPGSGDWLVRFASPVPVGDPINDLVAVEWHMARGKDGEPMKAPAIVIVHESGRGMVAGKVFAKGLRAYGYHTFLVHLPGYGARTSTLTNNPRLMLPALRQAIADVRRARDAVVALPFVDGTNIGLQGTSLGGFVTATVAGLDRGYDRVFILLAGGDIAEVILTGARDAAGLKRRLLESGISEAEIRAGAQVIEPLRLAHRVNAKRVWLFTGKKDEVVPPTCSKAFATAAKLPVGHHIDLPVGHYSAAFLMPLILPRIHELMRSE